MGDFNPVPKGSIQRKAKAYMKRAASHPFLTSFLGTGLQIFLNQHKKG